MSSYFSRWMIHLSLAPMLILSAEATASLSRETQDRDAPALNGAANLPASANPEIGRADRLVRAALEPSSKVHTARVTFYDPDVNTALEGGGFNRFSERVNSIEDAIQNGRPVSLAADVYGAFGRACNRKSSRCLLLLLTDGFDQLYPEYRKRFPGLPPNSFIGLVEDTGSAFFGTSGKRFDLAARNRHLARAIPRGFNDHVRWLRMENPCGSGSAGRRCDFGQTTVSPTMLAMLNVNAG